MTTAAIPLRSRSMWRLRSVGLDAIEGRLKRNVQRLVVSAALSCAKPILFSVSLRTPQPRDEASSACESAALVEEVKPSCRCSPREPVDNNQL